MAQFDSTNIKRLAVITSGGDAPGMNATVRAIVRTALYNNLQIIGVREGYKGLLDNAFVPLEAGSVANLIQRGGTFLKSARCPEFLDPGKRALAANNIRQQDIDGIVCVGGNGTFKGALALWQEQHIPIVGVPATIDNDINGTDTAIGFDSAINTALEAIDRIRDTAASHNRLFIVEVMGRDSGFIASHVALAGGAESVLIPEKLTAVDGVIDRINKGMARGKMSSILIAAEGQKPGRAYDLAESIRKKAGFDAKVCILGHIQRGGAPTASDRILASRLGATSVNLLRDGYCNVMVGTQNGQNVMVDLDLATRSKPFTDSELLNLIDILSY